MVFNIDHNIKSQEDARWDSLNDAVLALEDHLFSLHVYDINANKEHRMAFWLMDALNKYNIRRSKLLNQIAKTDLTEKYWIKFNDHLLEMENRIISSINRKDLDSEQMNSVLKQNFWLMDGFVRFKLQNCRAYMIKNGLECNISDDDLKCSDNPLLNEPSAFKVTKKSLKKIVSKNIIDQITPQMMSEIKDEASTISCIHGIIENLIAKDEIKLKNRETTDSILNDIVANSKLKDEREIFIETKSINPFSKENKNHNPLIERNPLLRNNIFINNNFVFQNQGQEKIKEEIKLENERIESEKSLRIEDLKKRTIEKHLKSFLNVEKERQRKEITCFNDIKDLRLRDYILQNVLALVRRELWEFWRIKTNAKIIEEEYIDKLRFEPDKNARNANMSNKDPDIPENINEIRKFVESRQEIVTKYYLEIVGSYEKLHPGKINSLDEENWLVLRERFVGSANNRFESELWEMV
jgi:hypothetical protein